MKKIINLEPEGMKSLHFYVEGLNYPVAVGIYSDWQETQLSFFVQQMKKHPMNTEDICRWCISHNIPYQIVYPINRKVIIKHPYKYYKFLQLKKRLLVDPSTT